MVREWKPGERELHLELHGNLYPKILVAASKVADDFAEAIARKREYGWIGEDTPRIERALKRFLDRVGEDWPGYKTDGERFLDVILTLVDIEPILIPQWIRWLCEELKREGSISE